MKKLNIQDNRYELLWRVLRRHILRRTVVRENQDDTSTKKFNSDTGIVRENPV